MQWERYRYSIRSNAFYQVETKGSRVKSKPWVDSFKGGYAEYYGTIHNAAHMYYYTPRFGFASPPKNGTWKRQMKIAARHKAGTSSHINARSLYFGSQVSIQEWGRGSERVFGTTIHELTHAAHFDFDKSSYNALVKKGYIPPFFSARDGAKRLLETWATTAEVYLTNHWYRFVLVNNGQKIEETYKDYGPYHGYDFVDFFGITESINTMEVIYDNHKKTVFEEQTIKNASNKICTNLVSGEEVPCDPRNILNRSYYKSVSEHYVFTAEDYAEAEDCNGDCE